MRVEAVCAAIYLRHPQIDEVNQNRRELGARYISVGSGQGFGASGIRTGASSTWLSIVPDNRYTYMNAEARIEDAERRRRRAG